MISGWHITHLPIWVAGRERPWRIVEDVVVNWEDFSVEGFLLPRRPFYALFVPGGAGARVSNLGVEIATRSMVERRPRHWRRDVVARQKHLKKMPVVDTLGILQGRLRDFLFDEKSLRVTHLVISWGVLGDLLTGALVVPVQEVLEMGGDRIKIYAPGEPFL